jgi:hypothetical protein
MYGCDIFACENHRFDAGTGTWTRLANPPFPPALGWGASSPRGIHVMLRSALDHFIYDPRAEAWTRLAGIPRQFPGTTDSWLDYTIQASVAGRLYIMDSYTTWIWDPVSDGWRERKETYPYPDSDGGAGAALGSRIYVAGGREEGAGLRFGSRSAVQAFDVTTETWAQLAPLPSPRSGASAGNVGDLLCVWGGGVLSINPGSDPDTICYDAGRNAWENAPSYPGSLAPGGPRATVLQVGSELWVYQELEGFRLRRTR